MISDANTYPEFEIAPITLNVARPYTSGRWERYERSGALMERLNNIGRRRLVLRRVRIGDAELSEVSVRALNLYLEAGRGLIYFRRGWAIGWRTRAALQSLLSRIGCKEQSNHVARTQSTDQVSTVPGDAGRAREHCPLAPHWTKRRLG